MKKGNNCSCYKVVVDVFYGDREVVETFDNRKEAREYADRLNEENVRNMFTFFSVIEA